jgi:hypothetical protein
MVFLLINDKAIKELINLSVSGFNSYTSRNIVNDDPQKAKIKKNYGIPMLDFLVYLSQQVCHTTKRCSWLDRETDILQNSQSCSSKVSA